MVGIRKCDAYCNGEYGYLLEASVQHFRRFFRYFACQFTTDQKCFRGKSDVNDAEWIAKLLRVGLIEKSFIPSEDLRELRDLTRVRKKRVGNLTVEKNRIQKVMEASNVKLSLVISDVFGVSGRNLLERLIEQGYVDADDIEHRVRGNVKKNVSRIADSLFETLNTHQMLLYLLLGTDHVS